MEELERTFLAKELPAGLLESPSKEMLDIYLPAASPHPILRIRKSGDKYEITNKKPIDDSDRSRQLEQTIALTKEEYDDLSQVPGRRVQKTRYIYPHEGYTYEIDVFHGNLAGLVLIDIEFKSVAEKDAFVAPSFCGPEVTQESFLAGGMLAGKSYSDIETDLGKFGYIKIVTSEVTM